MQANDYRTYWDSTHQYSQPNLAVKGFEYTRNDHLSARDKGLYNRSRSLDNEQKFMDDNQIMDHDESRFNTECTIASKRNHEYYPYSYAQTMRSDLRPYLIESYQNRQFKSTPKFSSDQRHELEQMGPHRSQPKYFAGNKTPIVSPSAERKTKRSTRFAACLDRNRTDRSKPTTSFPTFQQSFNVRRSDGNHIQSYEHLPECTDFKRTANGKFMGAENGSLGNAYYSYQYPRNHNEACDADDGYYHREAVEQTRRVPRFIEMKQERCFSQRKFYKVHCCCFAIRWPPWAVEEVDPPQPMYRYS